MSRWLRGLLAITWATMIGAWRSRILLITILFAATVMLAALLATSVTLTERSRFVVDFGLSAASLLGSTIGIALVVTTMAAELARRTAYCTLARPITRLTFLGGKYAGLVLAVDGVIAIMFVATAAVCYLVGGTLPSVFWPSLYLTWLEMALVCAISMLFAANSAPALAASFSTGAVIAGHFSGDMLRLATYMENRHDVLAPWLLRFGYYILPDLDLLSLRPEAANQLPAPVLDLLTAATTYSVLYVVAVLALATAAFNRRRAL